MKQCRFLFLSAAIWGLLGCGNDQLAGGSGTQEGNAKGRLLHEDGTPAAGVEVRFYPANTNPRADTSSANIAAKADSTVTNSNGEFGVTLDSGLYSMLAETGELGSFHDSVVPNADTSITDTLKPLGDLLARVALQGQDDPRTVFVVTLGTNIWTTANSQGDIALARMAEGRYRVHIFSTLDSYEPLDTVLFVRAGKTDTLASPIRLRYTGIPIPSGLQIQYDSMMQIVTLTWGLPAVGRPIDGYIIYRANVDSATLPITLNSRLIADTVYRDSAGTQGQMYEYRVAAVDTAATVGAKSGAVAAMFSSAYTLAATFGSGQGSGPGQFNTLRSVAVDENGNVFCADAGNNRIQKFDSSGTFLLSWGTLGSTTGKFSNPIDIALDSTGNVFVADQGNHRIQKFNNDGLFLGQWGSQGSGDGQFQSISSITINGGSLYAGDWDGQCVQEFLLDGTFVTKNPIGLHAGSIAVDETTLAIIADNQLVIRYSINGFIMDTIYSPGKFSDSINALFYGSIAGAIGQEVFVVSNLSRDGILGLDRNGNALFRFGLENHQESPQDVWIWGGAIFVAPLWGSIQKYVLR